MLVSVVITTYKRPERVKRAIQSVLKQTYNQIEIIVIEDGTDSGIETWLKNKRLEHVRYIHHEENRGLSAARNTGLKKAKGKYVAFLDDDDELKPDSISKRVSLFKELNKNNTKNIGTVYSGVETNFVDKKIMIKNMPQINGDIFNEIKKKGLSTIPSTSLFEKATLIKIKAFDENMVSSIDHDLWMNMAAHRLQAFPIYEPLTIIYEKKNKNSMVTDTKQRIKGINQFLSKWHWMFSDIFGEKKGVIWEDKYRSKVLGVLAAKNICKGKINNAAIIICSVVKNNSDITMNIYFFYRIIRNLLRNIVPQFFFTFIQNNNKNISQ